MFFKSATIFRLPPDFNLDDLEDRLREHPLKPVGPSELRSRGFVSPFGHGNLCLVEKQGPNHWLTLGGEDRILPPAVLNKELNERIAKAEDEQGRRLGGRARKRLKEDVVLELLPRAFVRPMRLDAHIANGIVWINTSARKQAENLVSELRHAIGSFPALPVNAEVSARGVLTGWVAGEPLPKGLALGDECLLQDPIDGGAKARLSGQELLTDEVTKHLEAGKQVARLGLVLDDHISFVLGEDLVVRKLKFLDGALEALENVEANEFDDSLAAELCTRYALMTGELLRLWAILEPAFQITNPYEEPLA